MKSEHIDSDKPTERHVRPGSIVIVDDEEVVLRTLSSFLSLETDYQVYTFTSAEAALESMKDVHVDLVISDFLMPAMNGLEFLAEVKRRYPDAVRVLLTGYADRENAIKAINEVGLFQYIEKPWDNDQLILVIKSGLRQRRLERTLSDKALELDRALLEKDRLVQERESFREELELARRIQESLLPRSFPEATGFCFSASYLPALQVGGDFYDVIPLAGGDLAAVVADVTGHGIQAALSTTMLKAVFTEFAHQSAGPADILTRMNRVLHRVLPNDIFVAASVASLESRSGVVRIANSGGPFPFHIKRSSAEADAVTSNGLLLGVFDENLYRAGEEVSLVLNPGDGLLIYTDGLSEVENTDGDQYGETRLHRLVSESSSMAGPELSSVLLEGARGYSTKDHKWDDITILAIDRREDL